MKKRIKKKFLIFMQIILSKKAYLTFIVFALILPVFVLTVMQERKGADGVVSPSLVTKRFGECETCDVKTVDVNSPITMDAIVEAANPDANFGSGALYMRWSRNLLMYYNVSSIPANTRIVSAKLRLFIGSSDPDAETELNQPIYRLHGQGLWKESEVTFNKKSNNSSWSGGNILSSFNPEADKISNLPLRNWHPRKFVYNNYTEAEMTSAVQDWVDNPSDNLGFFIPSDNSLNMYINSKEGQLADNIIVRPYLEVTYEGPNSEVIPQASGIQAHHHSGQTFVVWNEVATGKNETSYRIYRSNQPISSSNLSQAELVGQVYQGSSYVSLLYLRNNYQPNLSPIGLNLNDNTGLFVYTSRSNQVSYFAVTTVVEGNENRELSSNNSSSSPITESVNPPDAFFLTIPNNADYSVYVMWVSDFNPQDPNDQYGYTNLASMPIPFSVVLPKEVKNSAFSDPKDSRYLSLEDRINKTALQTDKLFPLTFYLHPWSHGVEGSGEGAANSNVGGGFSVNFQDAYQMVYKDKDNQIVNLGNFIESDDFGYSWYSGWNSNYIPTLIDRGILKTFVSPKPYKEGRSVPYTEKTLRLISDWMRNYGPWYKNVDKNRFYMTGGSMGGGGSLAFAIHNPGLVTAIDVSVPFTEMHDNLFEMSSRTPWGLDAFKILTPPGVGGADGIPIYDYLNIGDYLTKNKGQDLPIIRMLSGKRDVTVPWNPYTPSFYTKVNDSKTGMLAYFNNGDHGGCVEYQIIDDVRRCVRWDDLFKGATSEYILNPNMATQQNNPFWNYFHFKTNQSYPAFSNFSKNSYPGTGDLVSGDDRGVINRYQTWDTSNIIDTQNQYSLNLSLLNNLPPMETRAGEYLNIDDVETTDVTLRRLQNFAKNLPPGQKFKWQNIRLSDNAVIQEGGVVSDADGLITVPLFQISKSGSKLYVEVINDGVVRASFPSSYSTYVGIPITIAAFITGIVPATANYMWTAPGVLELSQTGTNGSISLLSIFSHTGGPPNSGNRVTLKILDGEPAITLAEASTTLYVHRLADINGDSSINFTDFQILLSNWGTPMSPMADLVRTGTSLNKVDFQDFQILLGKWGN